MNSFIHLCGTIAKEPLPEYAVDGEGRGTLIYRMMLDVPRLSGRVDRLPVLAPYLMMHDLNPHVGDLICFDGRLKSHRKWPHLFIEAVIDRLTYNTEVTSNSVHLKGKVYREPTYRTTPSGIEITDLMVSIQGDDRSEWTIPCITFDKLARFASFLQTGEDVTVIGRFQSRTYTKVISDGTVEKRVAYEVAARNVYTMLDFQHVNERKGINA